MVCYAFLQLEQRLLLFRLMDKKKGAVANKQNMIDVRYKKDATLNQKSKQFWNFDINLTRFFHFSRNKVATVLFIHGARVYRYFKSFFYRDEDGGRISVGGNA